MPWHIENDNPDCSGFAVVKDADGEVEGCHKTKADAMAQMAALYMNAKEEMPMATEERSAPAIEIRATSAHPVLEEEGRARPRISGHWARFGVYNEIDSVTEGRFLERIAPGAFRKTLTENAGRIRMLFQHGRDPEIGDKPIGAPDVLREDKVGPYFEADVFDSVPPLILDGLRAGQYGISYRFSVDPSKEVWDRNPGRSDVNPLGLPTREIREARVYEFGPVTFPADPGADYAVRAVTLTDLDAAVAPPQVALPADGAAPGHSDEGSRASTAPPHRERPAVEIQYRTRDEMSARLRELDAALARMAEIPGSLDKATQEDWDDKSAERTALAAALADWDKRLAFAATLATDPERSQTYAPPTVLSRKTETDIYDLDAIWNRSRSPEQRDQFLRDNAMRAVEIATYGPTTDPDVARTQAQRFLDTVDSPTKELARRILVTGSPVYRRAFNKLANFQPLSAEEQRGTALAVQVDGTGGFALPFAMDLSIIPIGSHSGWQNPYRQFARVETIVGTDTWYGLTSTAVTATRADEAAAATEQGPTFAQPSALVTKVQGAITYSIEMATDRPDIGAELGVLIAEAKDNEEEAIFSTGIGDALGSKVNPIGIFAAHGTAGAYTHIDLAAAHTLAIGDLDALEAAVPVRHRAQAVWLMNERTLRSVQGLETTGGRLFNGGQYPAVGPVGFNATGNTGLRLLNKPVYITPSATYDVTVDDTPLIWLGAGYSYLVLDRAGINVEFIPHVVADAAGSLPTGQRRLYFWYRNTAKPINTDGGRVLFVLNA